MELAAILFCLFFAMNIGASGAAASMGVAYGSGAVKKKTYALIICAAGVLSGAVIGGGEVVKTISGGIIPEQTITLTIVCIIIGSAALSLFTANVLGIPLSTSEVTVGAIVGVGVAYKVLFLQHLLVIVIFWVLVPFVAFCFSEEELQTIVNETIAEVGASSKADMGKVMSAIMPKVKGKADGSVINRLVSSQLS